METAKRSARGSGGARERSRRDLLIAQAGLPLLFSGGAHAAAEWMTRDPAQWKSEDTEAVLYRSPWVREVPLEIDPAAWGGAKRSNPTEYKVLVCWESGLPVRLARHQKVAAAKSEDNYVVSVSRLPMAYLAAASGNLSASAANPAEVAKQLAASSSIERDGKAPLHAVHAEWLYDYFSSRVAITFPRGNQPIRHDDWEVTVRGQASTLRFRARFSVKQMRYLGKLEL